MALFERGQVFHDKKAVNIAGSKGKYFVALSNADYDDDIVVCFVINTEHRMEKYQMGCNKSAGKFVIGPGVFQFVTVDSSIMLSQPCYYRLEEILNESSCDLIEIASDSLARQIKNCIDWGNIEERFQPLIKKSF